MKCFKKVLTLLPFLVIFFSTAAQRQPVYVFQKDDSVLKKKYYEQALQNKSQLIGSLGKEYKNDYSKIYESRFKEVAALLQSTRTVTAPQAHLYLQSVLKKITDANKELNDKEIRLFFSRDWWPNAYSMGEGTLVINAGLMIFLSNEAELAFVICHELAHYYLDHGNQSINKYVETVNGEVFQKELKKISKEKYRVNEQLEKLAKTIVFDSRRHSRDKEIEADKQAFLFMKKTGYNLAAIETCLELLDKVDDSLFFNRPVLIDRVFNFDDYPFKKTWIQKESAIFAELKEEETSLTKMEKDSLKTHPDCSRRILALNDSILKYRGKGEMFLIDELKFGRLKKDFFFEITEHCYLNNNLSRNLFYSLLLLENDPVNKLAIYSITRVLNMMYELQKAHTLGSAIEVESKTYPEEYNHLLRMFDRLRLEEIIELNTRFSRQYELMMKDYPGFRDEIKKLIH